MAGLVRLADREERSDRAVVSAERSVRSRDAPAEALLALQQGAGNRAVTALLARAAVLARKKYSSYIPKRGAEMYIDYDPGSGVITRAASKKGKYYGGGPHAGRGDHTTAMVTFVHTVENAVYDVTPSEAIELLREVIVGIRGLPGMQQSTAALAANGALSEAENKLTTAAALLANPLELDRALQHIPAAMDEIIVARNHVPLSAKTNSSSTKGFGEANAAGDLDYQQKQHQKARSGLQLIAITRLTDAPAPVMGSSALRDDPLALSGSNVETVSRPGSRPAS